MGECGCTDFSPLLRFKGPGKITYMLEIYPSCEYCNSPAGIVLYAFSPKDMREWQCDSVPELKVEHEGTAVPVIDPEVLKKKMVALYEMDSTEAVACEDAVDTCFKDAVIEQIQEIIDNPIGATCRYGTVGPHPFFSFKRWLLKYFREHSKLVR